MYRYKVCLFFRPEETGIEAYNNVHFTLTYLFKLGAKPEKTVLGVPFYGHTFQLKDSDNSRLASPAESFSFKGKYTGTDGFLGYNEICEYLKDPNHRWTIVFGKYYQAPYMFREEHWIGYDDERSIRRKTEFAYDQRLAGVMIWSIDTDDFTGNCFGVKFPLLRAINNALYRKVNGLPNKSAGAISSPISVKLILAVVIFTLCYYKS